MLVHLCLFLYLFDDKLGRPNLMPETLSLAEYATTIFSSAKVGGVHVYFHIACEQ